MQKEESLSSIFMIFLRFGLLAWGGPAAQIAMIREELVEKKQWISPEKFRLALAVYQALPGPEAHELCVYFGMVRAGRMAAFLAGFAFMLPGFLFMLMLSWAYVAYGESVLLPVFAGVAPAVVALIIRATHRIGMHTLTGYSHLTAAFVAAVLTLLKINFLLVFTICAVWQALCSLGHKRMAIIAGVMRWTRCVGQETG